MMQTKVRVQVAIIFGAVAVLLAYIMGRIDGMRESISWPSLALCLLLIIIAPLIAESNIRHRAKAELQRKQETGEL